MTFMALDDDERVISETAAAFAAKRIAPHALEWDHTKHFPVDVMREAAELGMAAIYCGEDVGGSGLRRLDAVRIFEELSVADPTVAAFISIHNMCAWMIDTYGTAEMICFCANIGQEAAKVLDSPTGVDGSDRELLPDRARCRIRRGGAANQGGRRR